MITYILGAGASFHAGYPLASNLGNALRNWLHHNKPPEDDARIHIDRIHDLYGGLKNIEAILTELTECPPNSPAAALESYVRPYLLSDFRESVREFFNGKRKGTADRYMRLARERVRPGDAIINFNYDLDCERELRVAGLWEVGDGYGFSLGLNNLPSSKVQVLKPHGSTNWFGLHFGGIRGPGQFFSTVFGDSPRLFFWPDFEYLGYSSDMRDPRCAGVDRSSGMTGIIMPTLNKHFFHETISGHEWERFWNLIWGQAEDAISRSSKIVIIGFSMSPADERARDLLLRCPDPNAEIAVFSGSRTEAICKEFREVGFRTVNSLGRGHFEEFLDS
jgi:hypothetical protein